MQYQDPKNKDFQNKDFQNKDFQNKPDHDHHDGHDGYDQHIAVKPDRHDPHPAPPVRVPEGGSTLFFVLAALTAIGWAVSKRYAAKCMSANTH